MRTRMAPGRRHCPDASSAALIAPIALWRRIVIVVLAVVRSPVRAQHSVETTSPAAGVDYGPGAVATRSARTRGSQNSQFTIGEAPHGFMVDGSSIAELNGIYGPKMVAGSPDLPPHLAPYVSLGLYEHADGSGWILANLFPPGAQEEGEEAPGAAVAVGTEQPRGSSEWVFIDPTRRHRFRFAPGTDLVPGHGTAWQHYSQQPRFADGLETVADLAELPLLLAPIPGDGNGKTSNVFEQLLVQLRRQKAAEKAAEAAAKARADRTDQAAEDTEAHGKKEDKEKKEEQCADAGAELWERGRRSMDEGRPAAALQALVALFALDREWPELLSGLVAASAAVARAAAYATPPGPSTPSQSDSVRCETVEVGAHPAVWPDNSKKVALHDARMQCLERIDRTNWLVATSALTERATHYVFDVVQAGGTLTLRRGAELGVAITHGWEIDLRFRCCLPGVAALEGAAPVSGQPVEEGADGDDAVPGPGEAQRKAKAKAGAGAVAAEDHYVVLGLGRDFTPAELKAAYHKTAVKLHPDRPGGSADAFARLAAAHRCLVDPSCKAAFDHGDDLERPNGEQSFAEAVGHRFYPHSKPFQPFGDPATFGDRRKGKRGWDKGRHGGGGTPPRKQVRRPPSGGQQRPSGWVHGVNLDASAAQIRDALKGRTLTQAETQELLWAELNGPASRNFVIKLLNGKLAELTKQMSR